MSSQPQRRFPLIGRQPQPSEAHERILATVRELLDEGGFHQATVDQIARRAGVAKATIYQRFGSKLGLIEALGAQLEHDAALGRVFRALALPDARDALLATVAEGVRFWCTHETLFRQLMGLAAVDPNAFEFVTHENRQQQEHLRALVSRLAEQGALRKGVSEDEAYAVVLLANSFQTVDTLRERAELTPEKIVPILQAQVSAILRRP
jgi:AcrR family transcriptional regulator